MVIKQRRDVGPGVLARAGCGDAELMTADVGGPAQEPLPDGEAGRMAQLCRSPWITLGFRVNVLYLISPRCSWKTFLLAKPQS